MKAETLHHESLFDHYVASHPVGDVLQTTHWGRLKHHTGWSYLPVAVLDNGSIVASALILSRPLPLPYMRLFYSPRGPLYSNLTALERLLEYGRKLAKEHGAVAWKMDPALPTGDPQWSQVEPLLHPVPSQKFGGTQPKCVMVLDLKPDLDTLLRNMKSKTRYNIRLARRNKIAVTLSSNKDDIGVFYQLLEETAKRDEFRIRNASYFQHLWDCLIKKGVAKLFIAHYKDRPAAAAIVFRLGQRVCYVYGASCWELRRYQASHLLQWEMIRWAKGAGCTVYDFRGVSVQDGPDDPLQGLYRFKAGFGAERLEYVGEFEMPCSLIGYGLWRTLAPAYEQLQHFIQDRRR